MTEDDELREFDLSAWEAPPPPVDFADSVIARAREGTPALEVDPEPPSSRARRRLIGAAAVAALAVAAVAMIWFAPAASREPKAMAGEGSSSGSDARRLELPGAIATLDPGADITWHRSGDDLVVTQRAGNATWQVDGSHRLVLDTGAVGASIEATGASLRVEVPMNAMDKRVLGGSAITAAIVSIATVTVYEGHVKTTTPTQTVIVKPGEKVAVTDDRPTVTVEPGHGVTAPVAGMGETPGSNVEVVIPDSHDLESCTTRFHPRSKVLFGVAIDHSGVASITPKDGADLELGDCIAKVFTDVAQRNHMHDVAMQFGWDPSAQWSVSGPTTPTQAPKTVACDAKALADEGRQKLGTNDDVGALKALAQSLACKDDPSLYPSAYMAACAAADEKEAKRYFNMFTSTRQTQLVPICLRAGIDPRADAVNGGAPACDAQALADKARQELGDSADAQALVDFEKSLACRDDPSLYPTAYMAACGSKNPAKAKHWFSKLPAERKTSLVQICLRKGIDPR